MAPPLMTIASVGLPLLQKLGESRDVRRYKQQLEQQQKTANLINALSRGRIQIQPTAEYKPSAFTQLAGAASTGLGAYNTFRDLTAKRAATDRAATLAELQLPQGQRTAATQEGLADYYSRERPKIGEWTPQPREQWGQPPQAAPKIGEYTPPPRAAAAPPSTGGPQLRGGLDVGALPQFEMPKLVSSLADLDKYRVMGREQGAATERDRLAKLAADEFERETRRMTAEAQRARAQAAGLAVTVPEPMTTQEKNYYIKAARDLGSLSPNITTLQEFTNHPSLASVTDKSLLNQMYSSYKIGARDRKAALGKAANERIEDFSKAVRTQQAVKDRFDIRRSLTEIVDGILIGGGFSDIGVLKALAKLQDPGSVVRQEEFTTLKQGIALFDRAGIKVDNFFTGNQLNADGRKQVLELGYASYNQRKNDIDAVVDNLVRDYSQRPGMVEGLDDAMWANAGLPYRLADTAELVTEQKMKRLQARVGGVFRTDLNDIKQWLTPPPAEVDAQAAAIDARMRRALTGK